MDNAAPGPDDGPAEPRLRVMAAPNDADEARGMVFTPDGGHLLVLTGVVTVWAFDAAAASLQERGWFGFAEDRSPPPPGLTEDLGKLREWVDRHASVEEVVVTPDGQHVIAGGRVGFGVWRLTPRDQPVATLVGKISGEEHDFYGMALAPDGRTLLALRRPPREEAEQARSSQGFEYAPEGKIERWAVDPGAKPPLRRLGAALLKDRPAAAAFTADGLFAAVVGSSQMLGVARLDGPAVTLHEQDADDTLEEVAALPGDRFATGGFDQVVRLWQLERAEPRLVQLAVLDHVHAGKLRALAAAPDGRWLVAASDDHSLSLWPATWSQGQVVAPVMFKPPIEYVHDLAIHPGGPWLATAGDGVRVWQVNRDLLAQGAGTRASVVREARAVVTDAPVIAAGWTDDATLVTAASDGRVQRWRDGVATEIRVARPGAEPVFAGDVAGGFAAFGREAIVVVDVNGGGEATTALTPGGDAGAGAPGTPGGDAGAGAAGTPGGDAGAGAAGTPGAAAVADATGIPTAVVPAKPEILGAIALAGNCAATGTVDGTVRTWRREGTTLTAAGVVPAALRRVVTLAWTGDARVLLVAGDEEGNASKLVVYGVDPATCVAAGGARADIPQTPSGSVNTSAVSPGGGPAPIAAAFSADGGSLLTGDRDGGAAILWRVEAGPKLAGHEFLAGHTSGVFAVAFAPDGKQAVTAGDGGEVYLWDVARRARVEALQPAGQPAWFHEGATFSPDGARLALPGGWFKHGRVWWYELVR